MKIEQNEHTHTCIDTQDTQTHRVDTKRWKESWCENTAVGLLKWKRLCGMKRSVDVIYNMEQPAHCGVCFVLLLSSRAAAIASSNVSFTLCCVRAEHST